MSMFSLFAGDERERKLDRIGDPLALMEKYPNLVYGRDHSGGGRVGLGGHIIAHFDAVVEVHAIDDFGQVGEAVEFAPMTFGSLDELEHQRHDGFA